MVRINRAGYEAPAIFCPPAFPEAALSSIRHQVLIAAPPRQIWAALTTAEGLQSWWVDEARVDGRKGGRVVVTSEDDDGNPVEARGLIHLWRPTSHLEFAFDTIGEFPLKGARLSFQIARDGEETRLALVHSGGAALEDEAQREALDKQWKRDLRALQGMLDAAE